MALVGLLRRHSLCKICIAFDDEVLNAITQDIILRKRSYREVREHYSPLLPPGLKPLNDVNINNHRRHSDPILFAQQHLEGNDIPVREGDMVERLYAERFHNTIDKTLLMNEAYRQRLDNLDFIRKLRIRKQQELIQQQEAQAKIPSENQTARLEALKFCTALEGEIVGLGAQISEEISSLQEIAIKHTKLDMQAESRKEQERYRELIVHAAITVMGLGGQQFLRAFSEYLMNDMFSEHKDVAHKLISQAGRLMDRYLKPSINSDRLLDALKDIENSQETSVVVVSSVSTAPTLLKQGE